METEETKESSPCIIQISPCSDKSQPNDADGAQASSTNLKFSELEQLVDETQIIRVQSEVVTSNFRKNELDLQDEFLNPSKMPFTKQRPTSASFAA